MSAPFRIPPLSGREAFTPRVKSAGKKEREWALVQRNLGLSKAVLCIRERARCSYRIY